MKKNYLFHLLLSITICWFAFQRYDKYIDNLTASLPTVDGKRYTIAFDGDFSYNSGEKSDLFVCFETLLDELRLMPIL